MKLSMWMIANRLSSLDLELNIRDTAAPILKSARRAYATNCVHVFQAGNDVICNGEGDYIRIKDMKITQAFEIVQCVFDFYEDWSADINQLLRENNYQEAVNLCWSVFHNPMLLFDGNCKVLGMSEQYTSDELDDEWRYLSTYGYSSVNAIYYMKFQQQERDYTRCGIQRFSFEDEMRYSGVTYTLYVNEALCGRINLFEKERLLNTGDYQILEMLADILRGCLTEQENTITTTLNTNLFYNLLDRKHVNDEQLEIQLSYYSWQRWDVYQLYLMELNPRCADKTLMAMMAHTLSQQLPLCGIIQRYPDIIILCNLTRYLGPCIKDILLTLSENANIPLACSLPRPGISHLSYLMDQARSAASYGKLRRSSTSFHPFYEHAMDYIIEAQGLSDCIQACHPDVLALWNQRKKNGDDMFDTLKCYLNNERSLVNTAQALFVHRNTLVYRVKKLTEFLHYDLDNVYTRDYMKLSIRTLELYDLKNTTAQGIA